MADDGNAAQLMAYRCPECNRTEVRVTPRSEEACPKCGAQQHIRVSVVGHALGYSTTDRSRGPSLHDTRLGSMAYFFGWMTLEQIAACLQIQRQATRQGKQAPRFGEAAVSAGFMTEEQVDILLHIQAIHRPGDYGRTFGGIAVHRGLVRREDIDACLNEQRRLLRTRYEAPFLGLMLMEKKLLTPEQVKGILELQAKAGAAPPGMEVTVAFRPAPPAPAQEAEEAEEEEKPEASEEAAAPESPEATAEPEEAPAFSEELATDEAQGTGEAEEAESAGAVDTLDRVTEAVSIEDLLAEDEAEAAAKAEEEAAAAEETGKTSEGPEAEPPVQTAEDLLETDAGERADATEAAKGPASSVLDAPEAAPRETLEVGELEEPFIEDGVGDAFDQLPAELTAEELAVEERERVVLPPPPKAGERRIVCRCDHCAHTEIHTDWHEGDPCPACGSEEYEPVPVEEGGLGYTVADRSRGPAVEDGRMGRLATYAGWATPEEVKRCLHIQQQEADEQKPVRRFGEVAVKEGVLSKKQVEALLRIQSIQRPKDIDTSFGTVAVRSGFITQEQLDEALTEQNALLQDRQEAPLLGMLLEEKGYLTANQVKAILDLQEQRGRGALAEIHGPKSKTERAVTGVREAIAKPRNWMLVGLVAALITAVTLLVTDPFTWTPPEVVAACRQCGEVVSIAPSEALNCPECGRQHSLAPVTECLDCGHVYLYGVRGSGPRCPKCGSGQVKRLESVRAARAGLQTEATPKKSEEHSDEAPENVSDQ